MTDRVPIFADCETANDMQLRLLELSLSNPEHALAFQSIIFTSHMITKLIMEALERAI